MSALIDTALDALIVGLGLVGIVIAFAFYLAAI